MRKIRKSSFFGILVIVTGLLFLIGMNLAQAQGQAKGKPDKPGKPDKDGEEVTWAVQLPTDGNAMLYGDGITYINNDNDVRIKVEKGYSRISKGQTAFHYYFCFKLVNPTNRYAGFQNVDLTKEGNPDEGPSGIFPGGCEENDPTTCMENFLNQNQPHPEYEYFYLKFQVGQHSFTEHFGYIIEGIEDERWGYNDPVKFISFSDWIKFRVQNEEDFYDPSTEYHNVECDERNHDDDFLDNMNIWIVKLNESIYPYSNGITSSDGVWRISVTNENLWVQEQYTKRAEGKGKKEGTKTVTVVPLEAIDDFSFYIDFIKNPSTDGTQ